MHDRRSAHREQPELSNSQLLKLTLVSVVLDDIDIDVVDIDVGLFTNCFRIISVLLPWYKYVLVCILQMNAGMITMPTHAHGRCAYQQRFEQGALTTIDTDTFGELMVGRTSLIHTYRIQ